MRRLLVVAVLAAAVTGAGAGSASAYCDPKYYPRCTNDCKQQPLDPNDLWNSLFRMCPE